MALAVDVRSGESVAEAGLCRSFLFRVQEQAGERAAARTDPRKAGEKIRNPANSRWASAAAVERAATTEPAGPVRNDIAALARRMQPRRQ